MENGEDGPVFKGILTGTVLPTAFQDGNRWLASWAFWMLHRRDLSVRILVVRDSNTHFCSPPPPDVQFKDTVRGNGPHCRDQSF